MMCHTEDVRFRLIKHLSIFSYYAQNNKKNRVNFWIILSDVIRSTKVNVDEHPLEIIYI